MKRTFLYIILNMAFCVTLAQEALPVQHDREGFFLIAQGGYGKGIGHIKITDGVSGQNDGQMYRLRAIAGYFLSSKLSVGLGAGLDGYHQPDFNTLPVLADVRYYFKTSGNHPFAGVGLGYSIKLNNEFKGGMHTGMNLGYHIGKGRKTPVLLSAGIDFHQIKDANTYVYRAQTQTVEHVESTFWLTSLSFGVAVLF